MPLHLAPLISLYYVVHLLAFPRAFNLADEDQEMWLKGSE